VAVRNKPTYALQSVDAALRLAQMLQAFGPMRVSDVSAELGVGVSTAHRLLAMLVYRGFAEQLPDRRYGPGAALRPVPVLDASASLLRDCARGPMLALVSAIGESANLVVLDGSDVRFIATVECDRVLRVGDRAGQRLPAHLTSGGRAIIASLSDVEVERVQLDGPVARARLRREVLTAREAGYASNHQDTEKGLSAIGVALAPLPGSVRAAVALAMPTARYRRSMVVTYVAALTEAARRIERAFAAELLTPSIRAYAPQPPLTGIGPVRRADSQ
jgi:IclR family transcriptional regulator, acetate operon repressor